jgi:hypothetical protein
MVLGKKVMLSLVVGEGLEEVPQKELKRGVFYSAL